MQDVLPVPENVSFGQSLQNAVPVPEAYCPAGQAVQDVFPVPEAYVPTGQAKQGVLPVEEECPAGQGVATGVQLLAPDEDV